MAIRICFIASKGIISNSLEHIEIMKRKHPFGQSGESVILQLYRTKKTFYLFFFHIINLEVLVCK